MNDVISAVLGEKQRVLMEALADYNECVEAASKLDPEGQYIKLIVDAPLTTEPVLRLTKRVAVAPYEIKQLVADAIDEQRDVRINYKDSEGERTSRIISPVRWRDGRFRDEYALLVARDVVKNDIRHFRLDRIERAEDV